jgi:hypothetical protein
MSSEDDPWLLREEIEAREHQARLRELEEWPKRLEEICREAEERWRAAHPWLAPGWCVTVPVKRLSL